MGFIGVPWVMGGGAVIPFAVGRVFANIATQGVEGVNLPGDFKVRPMAEPTNQVRIAPGAVTVLNRFAQGQSYIGWSDGEEVITVPDTGSAEQFYMLLARIRDPSTGHFPAYPASEPGKVANGPYFEPFLQPCSANHTKASDVVPYSAVALARIRMPANATVVGGNPSDVVDLRKLGRARTWTDSDLQRGTMSPTAVKGSTAAYDYVTTAETDWHNWPRDNAMFTDIPEWAIEATCKIVMNNVPLDGSVDVNTRIQLGPLFETLHISYLDQNATTQNAFGSVETRTHTTFAKFAIPANLRGTRVALRQNARRTFVPNNAANVWFTTNEQIEFSITYKEVLV